MGRARPKYMCEQCHPILIPDLYFYDVKYHPILSKIDKKSERKKKLKWVEMGRTRPISVGWAADPLPNGLVTVPKHSNEPSSAAERVLHADKKNREWQTAKETGRREITCGDVVAALLAV